jgi:hypothetical protein
MTVETDAAPKRMPIFPSMPDIAASEPAGVWKAGDFVLVLVTDVRPLSARVVGETAASGLHYEAAFAVLDRRVGFPRLFVTLERSAAGRFLCRFTEAGLHENCGLADAMTLEEFAAKAIEMFTTAFAYSGEIEPAPLAPSPTRQTAN